MKAEVARYIEKLKLTPIILQERLNKGDTIIEKFERLSNEASFAVALLVMMMISMEKNELAKTLF